MNDERLEELLIMACEKDITSNISVGEKATAWAALKRRRIQISLSETLLSMLRLLNEFALLIFYHVF